MPKQPETKFKESVQDHLELLKPYIWYYKAQQVSIRGIPDMILCVCGKFFAWELKVPPNRLNLVGLQAKVLADINKARGEAHEVTPENFADHWSGLVGIVENEYGPAAVRRARTTKLKVWRKTS